MRATVIPTFLLLIPLGLLTAAADRDFSGTWVLDQQHSKMGGLPIPPGPSLKVSRQGAVVHCTESGVSWTFRTDGTESKYQIRDSAMSSAAKWEGSALLINTLVSGPRQYVIEDRWALSTDRKRLTITRTIRRGAAEAEAALVYQNQELSETLREPEPPPSAPAAPPAQFVVAAGTKIPLSLINSLDTKYAAAGDRVYLETAFPVIQDGRILVPKGSYVAGTVTEVKRAGRIKGKAELFVRFDSLTLPNGVTRYFRARLDNAGENDVDRQEGKILGDSNKGGDARTVAEAAGAGASVGAIAGGIAGHGAMGAGIGAIGGAAAGLVGVLVSRGPDLILPRGTTIEMVLDRELHYTAGEVPPR